MENKETTTEELTKAYTKGFEAAKGEGKIYRALAAVQAMVKAAAKSGANEYDHYSYAMLNDYCEVIRVPMAENGLALSVDIESVERLTPRKTRNGGEEQVVLVVVKGILMHESGETLSFTGYGEGQDRSDKAIYKAITGAKKYLIANIFNVPTSDDPEKDSDAERDAQRRPPAQRPPQQPPQQRPPKQPPQQRPPAQPAHNQAQRPPQQPPVPPQPPVANRPPVTNQPPVPTQPPAPRPPAPKTDEQREQEGCINAQQYDNITSLLVANKISSRNWRAWLKFNYTHDSAQDIKQSEYEGIVQSIQQIPDQIKVFAK